MIFSRSLACYLTPIYSLNQLCQVGSVLTKKISMQPVIHVQFSLAFKKSRNVRRRVLCAPLEQFAIAKRTLVIRAPVKTAMKKFIRQKERANAKVSKFQII